MRSLLLSALALSLGLGLSACSSGADASKVGGTMFIESCSLGCGDGQGGSQVNCSIVNVGRNVEITVLFSEPVQLNSAKSASFRVTNTTNGTVPTGTFNLDPSNPRRLIFRPSVTFDEAGNPKFALDADETYEIFVLGEAQGDNGPFVQSMTGRKNQSRLQCTVRTSEPLVDLVPGKPVATAFLTAKDTAGNGQTVPAAGAQNVCLDSQITIEFNDVMNPATLAHLTTKQPTFMSVKIDPDGNTINKTDQVTLAGSYEVDVDFDRLRTTVVFTPTSGFPSSGTGTPPRRMVLNLPSQIRDLFGNQLANAGDIVFTTESIAFPLVSLPDADGENFDDTNNRDDLRSSQGWGGGRLGLGLVGGSGRLGELVIPTGVTVTLDTDSQDFPLPAGGGFPGQDRSILDNYQPGDTWDLDGIPSSGDEVVYDPADRNTWPKIRVTDGAFEFSRVVVNTNARLVLTGSNPGRIYSRGELIVRGVIDVSGETPPPHFSNSYKEGSVAAAMLPAGLEVEAKFGGIGGAGGPNGGAGGQGGDRYDAPSAVHGFGGIPNPGAVYDGRSGENVGLFPDPTDMVVGKGKGLGGPVYPTILPTGSSPSSATIGNLEFSSYHNTAVVPAVDECRVAMSGRPGSGAAYALPGSPGLGASPITQGAIANPHVTTHLPNVPDPTPGGESFALALEEPGGLIIRKLDFFKGHLRGGGGGGGGGMSLYALRGNPPPTGATPCYGGGIVFPFWDHSGAGGGGGGGGLQLTCGTTLTVAGEILCIGGDGGSATVEGAPISHCARVQPELATNLLNCGSLATPGGGGSGGSLRLQADQFDIAPLPARLSVEGGQGGVGQAGSTGGVGSPGLLRFEYPDFPDLGPGAEIQEQAQEAPGFAPWIAPYDPADPDLSPPGTYASAGILSLGELGIPRQRPDSFNGSTSCWMKPEGQFFGLEFVDDVTGSDDPDDKGWNLKVVYQSANGVREFPYRGLVSDPDYPDTGGLDFETFFGQLLNHDEAGNAGSLFAVRFQGARALGTLSNPCNVALSGVNSGIEPDSLTPWVRHPAELNQFTPRPNMIRFTIVFDHRMTRPNLFPIESRVLGVTDLRIGVQPD